MSSTKPYPVEDCPPKSPESRVMYNTYWQSLQTGRMLLGIPLPNIKTNADVEVIYEPPPPKDRIYEARLAALKTIPSRDIALEANSMLCTKRINNLVSICLCILFFGLTYSTTRCANL